MPTEAPFRKICPHCLKEIKAKADICKFCRGDVTPASIAAAAATAAEAERIAAVSQAETASVPVGPPLDFKDCPFCAEEIKWAAIVCRHCGREQPQAARSAGQTLADRRGTLARAIQTQVHPQMRIESQSETQAVLVFGKKPNHLLHFLIGVFTIGLWWIVWLFIALTNGERRRLLSVDEAGKLTSRDY